MNGNTYATLDDESAADYDDEAYDDDDSYRSSEDSLLSAVRDRRVFPGRAPGIGGFLGAGAPWRPPLTTVSVQPTGQGVSTANLQTPAGNATLRLSEPVPNLEQFRANNQKIEGAINNIIVRLNSTQNDMAGLNQQLASVGSDLRGQIVKLRRDTRRSVDIYRKEQRVTIGRLRREQSSQQTTSLLMTVLLQQQLQKSIDQHTHPLPDHTHISPAAGDPNTGNVTTPTTIAAPAQTSSTNNALLFLPLMMMGMGQDSGDPYSGTRDSDSSRSSGMDSMMPLFLLFALNK